MKQPTCTDSLYSLYNGGLACSPTSCGQLSKCLPLNTQRNSGLGIDIKGCCRKSILDPNALNIIIYILIIPVIGIGSLGALGGGTVKRPFLQAILNYDATIAGDITSCLMFSAQLVNMIFILFQNHPDVEERPIINYEIGLIYTLGIPISMCMGSELANFLPLLPLLSFQVLFFVVISPVLLYYAKKQDIIEKSKETNSDLRNQSALLSLTEMKDQNQYNENQAKLYKIFYDEQCQRFPLTPILITLFNFSINELILLMRSSPQQLSPYFFPSGNTNDTENKDKQPCQPWNFYVVLLLIAVNLIITSLVYFFQRKKELLKDTINFYNHERYYNQFEKFFLIYTAGWATGFVAGFVGMAAGLMMVITMVQFKLIAAVAGATANYCYFLICLQVFTDLIVGNIQDSIISIGDQFFFYGLGIIGVLTFTNLGYYYLKKYKFGHIIFYIDFGIVILNIFGNIAWGVENSNRYGFVALEQQPFTCTSYSN
ncbi:unnamed protein product [Paramecium primaurelia]|uniref:Uncharacterized protein n=1 Tax=Paramecium primaurelia TaxID=5886 RepID=A0A8S1PH07_PARPR|nr:unnamed protein product [Paramecium primaurelia]